MTDSYPSPNSLIPNCSHMTEPVYGKVCQNLLSNSDTDYYKRFTGIGISYELICFECGRKIKESGFQVEMVNVCHECFLRIEDGSWEGIIGQPEVLKRTSGLKFEHTLVDFPGAIQETILDLQPVKSERHSVWMGLTEIGKIIRIEPDLSRITTVCEWPASLDRSIKKAGLHVSSKGEFAAIVDIRGSTGVVLDTNSGKVTMQLERGKYHVGHTPFSLAFFESNGKTLIVHQTDWKRLDISDPETGKILTGRILPVYKNGEPPPSHDLDYFHGGLLVSPDQNWIVDNGWVWHPVGAVAVWNLKCWLQENVWESEDGESKRTLCWRDYFWNGPICWVDNHTLAVWGYGKDDEWLVPAVCLYDVTNGKELRWFPGPVQGYEQVEFRSDGKVYKYDKRVLGTFLFDQYLFSFVKEHGISVWDIASGEELLHDPSFCPMRFHPDTHEFITLLPDGKIQISRLKGEV